MTGWLPPRENWGTALICALAFATFALANHLAPLGAEAERLQSSAAEQAARDAAHQQRIERAAQAMCGPQAAATWVDPTTVQCTPRRGIKPYRLAASSGATP